MLQQVRKATTKAAAGPPAADAPSSGSAPARPRPRLGGLGAAGALLRAAGALPRERRTRPVPSPLKAPEAPTQQEQLQATTMSTERVVVTETTTTSPKKLMTVEEFAAKPGPVQSNAPEIPGQREPMQETMRSSERVVVTEAVTTPQNKLTTVEEFASPMTLEEWVATVPQPITAHGRVLNVEDSEVIFHEAMSEPEPVVLPQESEATVPEPAEPEPAVLPEESQATVPEPAEPAPAVLPEEAEATVGEPVTLEPPVVPADFLEFCLGGPAAVLEAEIERAAEEDGVGEKEAAGHDCVPQGECFAFSMDMKSDGSNCEDSDLEAHDEGDDLEDMFDFDPTRVAELMNKGAEVEEITEHLQTAYADALERRLGTQASEEQSGQTAIEDEIDAARPQLKGDLSALMTPEEVTPLVTPTGAAARKSVGESIAVSVKRAMDETRKSTQERSRRSLAIQHRPSAAHRESAAVKAMEAFGRRSIAQAEGEDKEQLEGAVKDAVRRASVRHRRSVTKAVEVLEEAADALDVPLDKWSEEQMDSKVEIVQQAMEEAYRRHRRSITDAVCEAVSGGAPEASSAEAGRLHAQAGPDATVEARIRLAVAEAYRERQSGAKTQFYDDSTYQGYGGVSSYQGYDNATYFQGDHSNAYYYAECSTAGQQWSSVQGDQWSSYPAMQLQPWSEPVDESGHGASWSMQTQNQGQGWYADTPAQSWCQQSGGYETSAKMSAWDAGFNGGRQAPYSWGSA